MPTRRAFALTVTTLTFSLGAGWAQAQSKREQAPARRHATPGQPRQPGRPAQASRSPVRTTHPAPQRPPYAQSRGAGPDRRFHRGNRLPADYRRHQYVVENWRAHRLSAPPRGHQWIQVGADYVLIAIATGLITQIVLSH